MAHIDGEHFSEQPFTVIGVHSPEFDHEKDRDRVIAKVKEFNLPHPVMIDNNFSYWRMMGNRFWPTYYLIDKRGDIRYQHFGEGRYTEIEQAIRDLLAETYP